jgi:5-methylcytosine-specific restriction endonuclease McrA
MFYYRYSKQYLWKIYRKTKGHCSYCHKVIVWRRYGHVGEYGAWEVDHWIPKAYGRSNRFKNLWPSCIRCNRLKSTMDPRDFRRSISY